MHTVRWKCNLFSALRAKALGSHKWYTSLGMGGNREEKCICSWSHAYSHKGESLKKDFSFIEWQASGFVCNFPVFGESRLLAKKTSLYISQSTTPNTFTASHRHSRKQMHWQILQLGESTILDLWIRAPNLKLEWRGEACVNRSWQR